MNNLFQVFIENNFVVLILHLTNILLKHDSKIHILSMYIKLKKLTKPIFGKKKKKTLGRNTQKERNKILQRKDKIFKWEVKMSEYLIEIGKLENLSIPIK